LENLFELCFEVRVARFVIRERAAEEREVFDSSFLAGWNDCAETKEGLMAFRLVLQHSQRQAPLLEDLSRSLT